jgi:flagellar hook-associated protein 1 FlgK
VSLTGTELATSEQRTQYVSAQQTSLRSLELAGGVDTDQEMQKLLLIEQSYAANARVIQTVDEMIQTLLRI